MGAVLDLSERFWRGEVRGPELVRASGAVEEIAPDVLFVHAFANVTALRTAGGLVLVDTGNYRARQDVCRRARLGRPAAGHRRLHPRPRRSRLRPAAVSGRGAAPRLAARASSATATSRGASIVIARRPRGTG